MAKGKTVAKQREATPQKDGEKKIGGVTGKGFMPGKSGNPSGKSIMPKTLARIVRDIGYEILSDGKQSMSRLELVLRKAWVDAAQGNKDARQFIIDRGWGKVPLQINLESYKVLIEECEKHEIDWQADPILSAIIGIERAFADGTGANQAIGQA